MAMLVSLCTTGIVSHTQRHTIFAKDVQVKSWIRAITHERLLCPYAAKSLGLCQARDSILTIPY